VATPDGCAVVGPTQECGDAPFGRVEGGGEAGAIHVLQGAVTDDADGSRDHPFPDITSGVDAADPGGQVVVGDGDYEESVTVDKPLTLRGRCAEHVRILRPTGDDAPSAIRVTDTLDVRIAGLGVEGGLDAVLVEQSTNVVIEDVQVTGAKHYAFAFLDTGGARVER